MFPDSSSRVPLVDVLTIGALLNLGAFEEPSMGQRKRIYDNPCNNISKVGVFLAPSYHVATTGKQRWCLQPACDHSQFAAYRKATQNNTKNMFYSTSQDVKYTQ